MKTSDITLEPQLEVFLLSTNSIDKFKTNMIEYPLGVRTGTTHAYNIISAFDWYNSNEGEEYWEELSVLYHIHFGDVIDSIKL